MKINFTCIAALVIAVTGCCSIYAQNGITPEGLPVVKTDNLLACYQFGADQVSTDESNKTYVLNLATNEYDFELRGSATVDEDYWIRSITVDGAELERQLRPDRPHRQLYGVQDFFNRKRLVSENGQKKQAFYILQDFYRRKK